MAKRKPKFSPGDFIYCEWDDAYSVDEWTDRELANEVNNYLIQSVGILVELTESKLVLALNHDMESDNVSCIMHIPFAMIKTMRKLK